MTPPWPWPAPPEMSAQSLCGTLTLTPPTASISFWKPVKSTIATWSILMPRKLLDRLDLQRRPAEREGGVDFLRRLAGDLGVAVARDREFAEGAAAGPDQHQRVGAELALGAAVVGRVAVGLLVEALLRGGGARLLGVGRAGVGAEHQDRLRAGQQERVAVQGRLGVAGELEGLQLGGDREGEEAEQDPAAAAIPTHFSARLTVQRFGGLGRSRPGRFVPLRGSLAQLSQAGEVGGPQPGQEAPPGPVDLVLGRPRGLLLAIGGHERLRNHADARGRPPPPRPSRS